MKWAIVNLYGHVWSTPHKTFIVPELHDVDFDLYTNFDKDVIETYGKIPTDAVWARMEEIPLT
tara:strand:+ start:759 stop:947 length:189 start_codon:yes stop_codon:yes gene_type:complete